MKRIVTIQDISCVGKCSLTVALPIISAMGIETAIIPTAVLSTHTAFDGFTFRDLTDEIKPISDHWKKENFKFDAIYTGYLGSVRQVDIVADFIDGFRDDGNIVFVDPVMGDNGKLYTGFDTDFVKEMVMLCKKADIIAPNMTEAAFLLGIDYKDGGYDEDYIKNILLKLCDFGCKSVVLTGVSFDKANLGVMGYNSETDSFFSCFNKKVPYMCHGTGDIFASACVGAMARGFSLEKSADIAADFTAECIKANAGEEDANWYGVNFESKIPYLIEKINEGK